MSPALESMQQLSDLDETIPYNEAESSDSETIPYNELSTFIRGRIDSSKRLNNTTDKKWKSYQKAFPISLVLLKGQF